MRRRIRSSLLAVLLVAGFLATAAGPASADDAATAAADPEHRPVVFIHGGAGSGAQFESQAMRFASNGYPIDHIQVLDYNSLAVSGAAVPERLDALIAELQASTGAEQIDLLGHSLGTSLMQAYLADPARAADVAHYVNIDGGTAAAPPGGVATLALWGRGSPSRRIVGATNVYLPDQSHVQVATSRDSFGEMYRFFNDDEDPATLDIVPDPSGEAEIAGRAVYFPANDGAEGADLDVYEVDPATGTRLRSTPDASFALGEDGAWGPFTGTVGSSYEYAISRTGEPSIHHLYTQPLIRDDHLVRLNTSLPGEGIGALVERAEGHSSIVVSRYKEFWGDHPTQSDALTIDGTNVLNAATAPVTKNAIGVFVFDLGSDGVSNLGAPIASLFPLPFLTGVDLPVPAATPPDRTVSIVSAPRGDTGDLQIVNVPNLASSNDPISVQLNDYAQPATGATYTASFTDRQCQVLASVAVSSGRSLSDVVRDGVEVFEALALAGAAEPVSGPLTNEGPCGVVVPWPEGDRAGVEATAAAWGVAPDVLHQGAGRLVLSVIWVLANA